MQTMKKLLAAAVAVALAGAGGAAAAPNATVEAAEDSRRPYSYCDMPDSGLSSAIGVALPADGSPFTYGCAGYSSKTGSLVFDLSGVPTDTSDTLLLQLSSLNFEAPSYSTVVVSSSYCDAVPGFSASQPSALRGNLARAPLWAGNNCAKQSDKVQALTFRSALATGGQQNQGFVATAILASAVKPLFQDTPATDTLVRSGMHYYRFQGDQTNGGSLLCTLSSSNVQGLRMPTLFVTASGLPTLDAPQYMNETSTSTGTAVVEVEPKGGSDTIEAGPYYVGVKLNGPSAHVSLRCGWNYAASQVYPLANGATATVTLKGVAGDRGLFQVEGRVPGTASKLAIEASLESGSGTVEVDLCAGMICTPDSPFFVGSASVSSAKTYAVYTAKYPTYQAYGASGRFFAVVRRPDSVAASAKLQVRMSWS